MTHLPWTKKKSSHDSYFMILCLQAEHQCTSIHNSRQTCMHAWMHIHAKMANKKHHRPKLPLYVVIPCPKKKVQVKFFHSAQNQLSPGSMGSTGWWQKDLGMYHLKHEPYYPIWDTLCLQDLSRWFWWSQMANDLHQSLYHSLTKCGQFLCELIRDPSKLFFLKYHVLLSSWGISYKKPTV